MILLKPELSSIWKYLLDRLYVFNGSDFLSDSWSLILTISSAVFSEFDLSADYLREVLQTFSFQILVPAGKKQKVMVMFVSNLLNWNPTLSEL